MLGWYRRHRRQRVLAAPYPEGWETVLGTNVKHYSLLGEAERARLRDDLRILVAEKEWEGCGGLSVTEEMQVTIAAQASLLLLGIEHDYFASVLSVLVYPATFQIPRSRWRDREPLVDGMDGQAVQRGPVILAWDAVLAEGKDPRCGHNVVIHEFAHQLDFLDGYFNGAPGSHDPRQAERWYRVMTREYRRLQRNLDLGRGTFFGPYAGTNEGEFFAVVSERFFTRPAPLRRWHSDLYEVLAEYYRVDPCAWFAASDAEADATAECGEDDPPPHADP
jgi:Mlc titration factor MtfA (ptsG expression regulator)